MVLVAAILLTAGTVVFTLLVRGRELAKVLAEIDSTGPAVKAKAAVAPAATVAKPKSDGKKCPHCGATFPQPLKFCGECGKAMAS